MARSRGLAVSFRKSATPRVTQLRPSQLAPDDGILCEWSIRDIRGIACRLRGKAAQRQTEVCDHFQPIEEPDRAGPWTQIPSPASVLMRLLLIGSPSGEPFLLIASRAHGECV